jgi:pSer/pThr/pTyr-binding forkhead associated (FHA) protein
VVITVGTSHYSTVQRASALPRIEVNGVALGPEPHPLSHGDRLSIDGLEVVFGDEAHAGRTGKFAAIESSEGGGGAGPVGAGRSGRTGRTGGRLVSLTDGREYTIGVEGLSIGREAGCDVVIPATEVSRRHARIELNADGYALVDTSTNGVSVNGARMKGTQLLARGDTIRIGKEEFRFHADAVVPTEPQGPPVILATPPGSARAAVSPEEVEEAPATPGAESADNISLSPPYTAPGSWSRSDEMPAARKASARPPDARPPATAAGPGAAQPRPTLATLEIINEGPSKGTQFTISTPLAHVGRGAHNDVVIDDESVSDTHAKLQRRGARWVLVDLASTNGSYVAGTRVRGEAPLPGETDIRFGGVKLAFKSVGPAPKEGRGTRVVVGLRAPTPRTSDVVTDETRVPSPPSEPAGILRWMIGAVLLLVLFAIYLIVRSA